MLVGPSIASMIPMEAAWFSVNMPEASARSSTAKIPNCPAAPTSTIFGFVSSGPKSVIAPMPINRSSGKSSVSIPAL